MLVLMTANAVGGVWSYCVRLAEALADRQVRVALATMGPAPSAAQQEETRGLAHVELHESTSKLEWMQDPWDDVTRTEQWLLDLKHRLRPDIIHLNSYVHADLVTAPTQAALEMLGRYYGSFQSAGPIHNGSGPVPAAERQREPVMLAVVTEEYAGR